VLLFFIGCSSDPPVKTAEEIFESELKRRGIAATKTDDGQYELQLGDRRLTANLENVRRNYLRDGDPAVIIGFVGLLESTDPSHIPPWKETAPFVRYSLQPADQAMDWEGVIRDQVTRDLTKVFVYMPPSGARITWISESMLAEWRVDRNEIVRCAHENMNALAASAILEIDEIDGVRLGSISTKDTSFKASLILSPVFRDLVSPELGWPVFVVAPARDFVYVLSLRDREFLSRLGGVVQQEYNESGHPVTMDVLEVGDHGVEAIGTFANSQ
jgi:uncharacterized protein YtpQ (UPF0354 family)